MEINVNLMIWNGGLKWTDFKFLGIDPWVRKFVIEGMACRGVITNKATKAATLVDWDYGTIHILRQNL